MKTEFMCFYPSTPLWVGDKPDFDIFRKGGISLNQFLSIRELRIDRDNYVVAFCKDGLCMLRIHSISKDMEDAREQDRHTGDIKKKQEALQRWTLAEKTYVEYLNTIQLLLDVALTQHDKWNMIDTSALRRSDVFPVLVDDTHVYSDIDYSGVSSFHSTRDTLRKGRDLWNYTARTSIEDDPRIAHRRSVCCSVFDHVIAEFEKVSGKLEHIRVLSQTLIAVDNYNVGNQEAALVQAWFVIELFINEYWVRYLAEQQTTAITGERRINADRLKFLTGKDFTAAVLSNMLELIGRIDQATLSKIDVVRKARNKASHKLEEVEKLIDQSLKLNPKAKKVKGVTGEDCRIAFELLSNFIQQEYAIVLGLHEKLLF